MIGYMGTGKSTISKAISVKTDRQEIDLDAYIVRKAGKSINDIFKEDGETAFRKMETDSLRELEGMEMSILSCGGGTATRDENIALMKRLGKVVLLNATPETIYERVKENKDRPLLNGNMNVDFIRDMLDKRLPFYKKAADYIVDTDEKTVEQIAEEIIRLLFL